jgi:S1-C subfamily serine protease
MKKWFACAGLALVVCGYATASDITPSPTLPAQLHAASVESLQLSTRFAVDRFKSTVLPGETLGYVSRGGMFCGERKPVVASEGVDIDRGGIVSTETIQLLQRLGYPMAKPALAFGRDASAAPDFRLGGIIRALKYDICLDDRFEAEGWIHIKIDWALYSEREQKVVFQLTTDGLANSRDKTPDLWKMAYISAAENFIAAPGFMQAVKPGAPALPGAGATVSAATSRRSSPDADSKPPVVAVLKPLMATGQNLTAKLEVDPIKLGLLPGDNIGTTTVGDSCSSAKPVTVTEGLLGSYGKFVASLAKQSLKSHGYPLASQAQTNAFDTEVKDLPAWRIGAVLEGLKLQVCSGKDGQEGWVYARFAWALYSSQAQEVVFQRTTEGFYFSKSKIPDLSSRAFTVSFENFLASPELLAALSAAPPASDKPAAAANTSTASVATPATAAPRALQLAGGTMASGGAQKNQARLRAAVVTIESSKGTGSGFYIDRQGYLLTNFHVVQGAKFVKIKLQNGDKMVAEVVKANEHDDVALLKSPPVEFEPLTVRSDALEVGEEVFAVGTPLGLLDSTMTRGVLSADRKIQGLHLLQSDAAVTFGSSGGPLLDGNGQVIGITRAVLAGIGGFNIFVPVQDALKVLDIDIGSR